MYGRGLRSIRTRFTLLVAVSTSVGVGSVLALDVVRILSGSLWLWGLAVVLAAVAIPTCITFVLAGSLVGSIRALKVSTDAIIAGDMDRPVEVDCQCEVGGLADSFRRMVGRLNSNILRMNVLAYHDAVTGLTNRAVVEHVLARALDDRPVPMPLSVLFMDLDGFKAVNDTLGHNAGDDLLRQVARRVVEEGLGRTLDTLDSCTTPYGELHNRPPNDIVFSRFAGDEFIAIVPNVVDEESLQETCDRINRALARPFDVQGASTAVGVSIGIARAPDDAATAAQILVDADMAMYAAKEQGRGRAVFFDADLRQRLVERTKLASELRTAVESGQLVVHYQPKYDARSLQVSGYEALVRWQHPVRGLLLPGRFLDIAEEADLMCDIGGVVFTEVIAQIKRWNTTGNCLPWQSMSRHRSSAIRNCAIAFDACWP